MFCFQSPHGLGIMILEGKHAELGTGIFISDIQEGSPAEQVNIVITRMFPGKIQCCSFTRFSM